ncbi:MAG: DUF6455 family protein [Pseudomonadota bacterium]
MGIFKTISRNVDLMSRMFAKTGVVGKESAALLLESDLRQAMVRCACCKDKDNCAKWLDEALQDSAPPDFCENKVFIRQVQNSA